MNDKILKVKCDWCGKDIECPENMIDSEKHACFDCFEKSDGDFDGLESGKIHVDIPEENIEKMLQSLTENLAAEGFPGIWSENKQEFKEMSKKQFAKEMFCMGIYAGSRTMLETLSMMKKEQEKPIP